MTHSADKQAAKLVGGGLAWSANPKRLIAKYGKLGYEFGKLRWKSPKGVLQ
jgi:hypothetical protein